MEEKGRQSLEERIKSNCRENRNGINASRYGNTGLTERATKVSSHNLTKMMEQRSLSREATKEIKDSFQSGTMEARHGKKGEVFVITHGKENASGVFVSKQSLGKTPEERINQGALPPSNKADYETRVVLDRDQTVLSGKIAAQPDFMKQDPACHARNGGAIQTVTDGGFKSGAIRQEDPKYPVPVKATENRYAHSDSLHKTSNLKGQKR